MKKLSSLILLLAGVSYSFTPLKNLADTTTLSSDKSPYIIQENLTVKEGQILKIEEGCVLLFNPFCGLIVDGTLRIEGTLKKPVVFTTVNDTLYNDTASTQPNPFDWNGILIGAKAKHIALSNFLLTYSVYGIKSMKEEFTINNGTFNHNGQFHVVVNEAIKPAVDGVPYNYGIEPADTVKPVIQSQSSVQPEVKNKKPAVLATIGLISLGAGGVSTGLFFYSRNKYLDATAPSELSRYRTTMIATLSTAAAFTTAAAILIPASIVSKKKTKRTHTHNFSFIPVCANVPGGTIIYQF
jgi:hypothetical protein